MTIEANTILLGDVRDVLPTLPDKSVQMCVTSPPYWGLRDYGTATWEGGDAECDHMELRQPQSLAKLADKMAPRKNPRNPTRQDDEKINARSYRNLCGKCGARRIDSQLGLESTPEEFVTNMVAVFREVRRVLRDDGTCWVNMGDGYATSGTSVPSSNSNHKDSKVYGDVGPGFRTGLSYQGQPSARTAVSGLKPKDLVGMPWRLAFALQADGWWLRQDIVWSKPSPMPESVTDRCTKAHEYIFLLSKNGGKALLWRAVDTGEWSYAPDLSERITQASGAVVPRWRGFDYYFDAEAIKDDAVGGAPGNKSHKGKTAYENGDEKMRTKCGLTNVKSVERRNKRSVWTVASQAFSEGHFATFPEKLIEPCILAGCPPGGIVLDPFFGSGTTGQVCERLGRQWLGIELNPEYADMARRRTAQQGLGI